MIKHHISSIRNEVACVKEVQDFIQHTGTTDNVSIERTEDDGFCVILDVPGWNRDEVRISLLPDGVSFSVIATPSRSSVDLKIGFQKNFFFDRSLMLNRAELESGVLKIFLKRKQTN